jgi:hypothetical protein
MKTNFSFSLLCCLLLLSTSILAQGTLKTKNVIIVTLDGLRWQEIFTGADSALINNKEINKNLEPIRKKYWNSQVSERRNSLMPFFWQTIAQHGQIYGNRYNGNLVNVSNPYWFSYPGYSEIFCGYVDDSINTNDLKYNPNVNVLEVINKYEGFKGKVAAFASWDAFPYILNDKRSGVYVNAAFQSQTPATANAEMLNQMQTQLPDILGGVRLDAVTFYQGFEYLKSQKPRVLYIGLDETDDFAHEGRYDLYLNAINNGDKFISELWQWVQSQPEYKDKTTLLITCDHGRGEGNPGWRNHGRKAPNSDQTWFAIMGPDSPKLGEVKDNGQYYSNQFAQTIAELLGIKYNGMRQTGKYITSVFESQDSKLALSKK